MLAGGIERLWKQRSNDAPAKGVSVQFATVARP